MTEIRRTEKEKNEEEVTKMQLTAKERNKKKQIKNADIEGGRKNSEITIVSERFYEITVQFSF